MEQVFGILAQRFRIFYTNIAIKKNTVIQVVKAACVLHNILLDQYQDVNNFVIQDGDVNYEPPPMFLGLEA